MDVSSDNGRVFSQGTFRRGQRRYQTALKIAKKWHHECLLPVVFQAPLGPTGWRGSAYCIFSTDLAGQVTGGFVSLRRFGFGWR